MNDPIVAPDIDEILDEVGYHIKAVDHLINLTKTGRERSSLSSANIYLRQALDHLNRAKKERLGIK